MINMPESKKRRAGALEPFERGDDVERRGPFQVQYDFQEMMQRPGRHRAHGRGNGDRRLMASENSGNAPDKSASRAIANTTRAGTPRWI